MLSRSKLCCCLRVSLLACGLAFSAGAVSASVLVSQSFLNGGDGFLSNRSGGLENADSFSLGGASTVTAIAWWGTYNSDDDPPNQFSVRLAPSLDELTTDLTGTVSVDSNAPAGTDSNGSSIFRFDFVLNNPLPLAAGKHFLSVANEFAVDDPEYIWGWTAGSGGDSVSLYLDGSNWIEGDGDLSFLIIGDRQQQEVPEPGTLGLLGLGAVGMVVGTRRRPRIGT